MTEDATDSTEAPEDATQTPEDDRFEVKWRKKSGGKQAPTPDLSPTGGDAADLQRQLEEERQRTKDLQERWHRAAADLANLRRRTEQEKGEVEKFASMLLVQEILPVLDNFQRAIATIPGNLAMLTWLQGVVLIERHLRAILEHQGLASIEAMGQPFNPHSHEAISERETSEAAPGTVLQEYQTGYTMHGRVIRPALVEVAKAPSAEEPAEEAPPTKEMGEEEEAVPQAVDEEETAPIAEEAKTDNVGP